MPRTLFGKLFAALLGVLGVLSVVWVVLMLSVNHLYTREVSQKLNRDLAANLVERQPPVRDGVIDQAALSDSFDWMMAIHPAIEIYLLDDEGRILAYSAPPGKVHRERVDLEPVERFLDHPGSEPILGDDPRGEARDKVFSAARVRSDGFDGYLYVVLAGELYDSAAAMVDGSLAVRLGLVALAASVVAALVAGLLLIGLATRRLRRLGRVVARFEESGFREPVVWTGGEKGRGDEIDRLGERFERMARRIVDQIAEIRAGDEARRELVASVSHDLRTPLAALHGYLETLLLKHDDLGAEERRGYLEAAARHSDRLGKLVGDLFELAKLDSVSPPVDREPFSIAELVQDVVQKFRLAAEAKEVRLVADLAGDVPVVEGDIGLVERVLENLIDNALRHTPAGGEVRVQPTARAGRVRVQVSDTGCGIPDEELPFLFERFYHSGGGSAGSGLGLAIARRIVELHDGWIGAEPRSGGGAVFTFEIGAAVAAA